MKKSFLTLSVALLAVTAANAQEKNYQFAAGDRSVAVSANPVLNYFGNMFNNSENNNLNISGASIIYRKFGSKRVTRIRGSLNMSSTNLAGITPGNFDPYVQTTDNVNATFAYGHEYNLKNADRWRIYYGYEFIVEAVGNSFVRNYENTILEGPLPVSSYTRDLSYDNGFLLSGGLGGFFGAEYFLSKNFFVGAELSAIMLMGHQFDQVIKRERYQQGTGNTPDLVAKETERNKNGVRTNISNTSPLILRLGVRF